MKKHLFILTLFSLLVASCSPLGDSSSNSSNENSNHEGTSLTSESSETSDKSEDTSEYSYDTSEDTSKDTSSDSSSSQGGSSTDIDPIVSDSYWDVSRGLFGASLRNDLKAQIDKHGSKTTSYKSMLEVGAKAAAYPNPSSSTFVPFYHDTKVTTTTSSCNREHTWPNSRGGGQIETDPFVIRPTLTSDNSARGNNFYGNTRSNEWDPASLGFEGARGESARVALYAACRYYNLGLSLSNNPSDSTSSNTMGTLKTLLKWNLLYKPNAIEKQINNYLYSQGFGRNPFVDHPEYASWIWNDNGLISSVDDIETGGGSETGGESETGTATTHNLTTLEGVDGKNIAIVNAASSTGPWYALSSNTKSESLPWYILGLDVSPSADKKTLTTAETLPNIKLKKQSDGSYLIFNESNSKYLYNYIDGTHYSIGYSSSTSPSNGSAYWDITKSGDGYQFAGKSNVYLEYYKGSFCGYKAAPETSIYLYLV